MKNSINQFKDTVKMLGDLLGIDYKLDIRGYRPTDGRDRIRFSGIFNFFSMTDIPVEGYIMKEYQIFCFYDGSLRCLTILHQKKLMCTIDEDDHGLAHIKTTTNTYEVNLADFIWDFETNDGSLTIFLRTLAEHIAFNNTKKEKAKNET